MKNNFKIENNADGTSARTGILNTEHGKIPTPAFIPIATYGAVKTQSSLEIEKLPSNILLSNTYHLFLRPGTNILEEMGGLHKFMNWNGAILTDSGGFQIYSLKGLRKITQAGVTFQSHLDGTTHELTPEKVVDIQRSIGSDIMMMLDVCPSGDDDYKTWVDALEMTTHWAKRSLKHFNQTEALYGYEQIISPIVQGGTNLELRKRSALELLELECQMYAIGGLAVGEPKIEMLNVIHFLDDILPKDKPRYLMGVGTPTDLVECVLNGIDLFDCVMPTRNARNGQLFTFHGKMNIRNKKYRNDYEPIDSYGFSPLSMNYTKSYLHHLYRTNEILGLRIATEHNLKFYIHLMSTIREQIIKNTFNKWAKKFIKRYQND